MKISLNKWGEVASAGLIALGLAAGCDNPNGESDSGNGTDTQVERRPDAGGNNAGGLAYLEQDTEYAEIGIIPTDSGVDAYSDAELGIDVVDVTENTALRVNHVGDINIQLIEDTTSGRVDLSQFELCADGGDVEIDSITADVRGTLDDFAVNFAIDGNDETVRLDWGDDTIHLLSGSGDPIIVEDGTCEVLDTTTELPVGDRVTWFEPTITDIGVLTTDVEIEFEDGWAAEGHRTIFNPQPGHQAAAQFVDGYETAMPNIVRDERVGRFEICTDDNEFADIYSADFRITGLPETNQWPIRTNISITDGVGMLYELRDSIDLYGNESTINWTADRPDGLEYERIEWGGCMLFDFEIKFVPSNADQLLIELVDFDAGDQEPVVYDNRESYEYRPMSDGPEPWMNISFFEPDNAEGIFWEWAHPYATNRERYYTYSGSFEDTSCRGESYGTVDTFEHCPLLTLQVDNIVEDTRFPILINSIDFNVRNRHVSTEIRVVINENEYILPIEEGLNEINLPLGIEVDSRNNISLKVHVDEFPEEDTDVLVPPSISFEIVNFDTSYAGSPIQSTLLARDPLGSYGSNVGVDLPYRGPEITIHTPELWVESHDEGAPEVYSLEDYYETMTDEPIFLFRDTFNTRYGSVEICEASFRHGTAKTAPPSNPPVLRIDDTTLIPWEWDREHVTYTVPGDNCIYASSESIIPFEVTITNPDETTEEDRPWSFELYNLDARDPGGTRDIPLYVGYDLGTPIELGDDDDRDTLTGPKVNIVD